MEVAINNNIYKQASDFAEKPGLNLTSVIEDFLKRFIIRSKTATSKLENSRIPVMTAAEYIASLE